MPRFMILAITAPAILGMVACSDDDDGATPTPSPTPEPSLTAGPTAASPTPAPSPSATPFPNVCLPNPDPATPEFQILDQPAPSSEVTSPVTVSGQVNYFEATYQIAVYDAKGAIIVETFGTAQQPDIGIIGPFSHDVAFAVSVPTAACLWVYEQSAMDGSSVHVGQVPLVLLP
ncbi:MAG TPA: Gmad2 immunoglobulin-like domain-containing protein [Dehalococcoidia bacterium]